MKCRVIFEGKKTLEELLLEDSVTQLQKKIMHKDESIKFLAKFAVKKNRQKRELEAKIKEALARSGIDWAWIFYESLGYRIVEDGDSEAALKKTMDDILNEILGAIP